MNEKAGLYIHVPYCAQPCGYCDFYKEPNARVEDAFVEGMIFEMSFYSEEPRVAVDTVYFGGGTPSLLSRDQLDKITRSAGETFDIDPSAEVTMEANPETLTEEKLSAMRASGVNRLSIGVQSLKDECLEALSRRVRSAEVLSRLELLEKESFGHLSFDLMLGAPGTTAPGVLEDIDALLNFPFCHVSLYMLELHKGTALYEKVRGGLELPPDEKVGEAYVAVAEALERKGFVHYEISNFARKGCECRHNLKYWKREDYIGLGPSAHGRFRGTSTRNPADTAKWLGSLRRGELPHEEAFRETALEELENRVIFGLRLKEGIEEEVLEKYGAEGGEGLGERVFKLCANGIAERKDGRVRLTRSGFLLSSEVTAYLLSENYRARYEGTEE